MKLFYLLSAIAISNVCWAQDPQFTQVYLSKVYMNPAYAGVNQELTLSNSNRFQWGRITPQVAPFRTHDVSIDIGSPALRIGTGISLFYNREGEGNLTTTSVSVPFSYALPLDVKGGKTTSALRFGIQASVGKKTIDWSKLVFSDQLDPIYGNIYASSALPAGFESGNILKFNAGVLYQASFSQFTNNTQTVLDASRVSVGAAIHNLSESSVSLISNSESYIPKRYTFHLFVNKVLKGGQDNSDNSTSKYLSIGAVWQGQKTLIESPGSFNTSTILASFTINNSMLLGGGWRNKFFLKSKKWDALYVNMIVLAIDASEVKSNFDLLLGFNYDYTLPNLGVANTFGSFEISMVIRFIDYFLPQLSKVEKREKRKERSSCNLDQYDMYRNKMYKGHVNFGMYYLP